MAGTSLEKHEAGDVSTHDAHGELDHHAPAAVARYNPDAPSEEWGWHGQWRLFAAKGSKTLLVVFTAVIFLMLFGNHVSRVEDWYLVLVGFAMIIWLVWRESAARRRRRLRP